MDIEHRLMMKPQDAVTQAETMEAVSTIIQLRQQLAAALAACEAKDDALIEMVGYRAQAGELERLKELLRTNFMDDHLRIDLHFKDYHIRKLVRVEERIDFTHIIGAMTREMWEDLNGALVRSGVTK